MVGSIFEHGRTLGGGGEGGEKNRLGSLKGHTGIMKESKCNHISILRRSHQDLDTITSTAE